MPFRQTWPVEGLNELDADAFSERAGQQIDSMMSRYAPNPASSFDPEPAAPVAPAPTPSPISFDLAAWSPWNQTPAASAAPVASAPSSGLSFDLKDWAPWHQDESRASTNPAQQGIAPAQPSAIPGPDLSPESGTPVRSAAEMNADGLPTAGEPGGPPLAAGPVWEPPKGAAPAGDIDNSSRQAFVRTA